MNNVKHLEQTQHFAWTFKNKPVNFDENYPNHLLCLSSDHSELNACWRRVTGSVNLRTDLSRNKVLLSCPVLHAMLMRALRAGCMAESKNVYFHFRNSISQSCRSNYICQSCCDGFLPSVTLTGDY